MLRAQRSNLRGRRKTASSLTFLAVTSCVCHCERNEAICEGKRKTASSLTFLAVTMIARAVLRENGWRLKSGHLGKTEHQVHALDGLSGGSLDQVVNTADDDKLPGIRGNSGMDKAHVASPGMLAVRR